MIQDCIFCKIVNKDISARIVYENDSVIAFYDVHPLAPVHVLIIPKKHIPSMNELIKDDISVIPDMFIAAGKIVEDHNIARDGYKLLVRTGVCGGQEVPHVHLHVIGGAQLHEDIHAVGSSHGDVE